MPLANYTKKIIILCTFFHLVICYQFVILKPSKAPKHRRTKTERGYTMEKTFNYNNIARGTTATVEYVEQYAMAYDYIVARPYEGHWYFWGAYEDMGTASECAYEIGGRVFPTALGFYS